MKSNMTSDIDSISGWIQTPIPMMKGAIPEKNTWCGVEIRFVVVIGPKVREALAAEHT